MSTLNLMRWLIRVCGSAHSARKSRQPQGRPDTGSHRHGLGRAGPAARALPAAAAGAARGWAASLSSLRNGKVSDRDWVGRLTERGTRPCHAMDRRRQVRWSDAAGRAAPPSRVGRGPEAPAARGARNRLGVPRREARHKSPRRQNWNLLLVQLF